MPSNSSGKKDGEPRERFDSGLLAWTACTPAEQESIVRHFALDLLCAASVSAPYDSTSGENFASGPKGGHDGKHSPYFPPCPPSLSSFSNSMLYRLLSFVGRLLQFVGHILPESFQQFFLPITKGAQSAQEKAQGLRLILKLQPADEVSVLM